MHLWTYTLIVDATIIMLIGLSALIFYRALFILCAYSIAGCIVR